jgi:hypothetical protein
MAEENIVIKIKADVGVTKEVIDAVTKAMEGLGKTATIVSGNVKVTNKNLEDTNKILGQVAQTAAKTGGAIGGTGDALKKSNQQWTNLALVVQDLPYGFRGIQNNLPALIGGFAGVTGGIYFAASAIIAFFTAYDNGAFGAKKSTDAWAESVKKAKDELKSALDYSDASTQKLKGLISIGNDYTQSETTRAKVLKEVKDELGKVNKVEADKIKNMADATRAVGTYTEAVKAQNIAEIAGKRLAELEIQQLKDRAVILASSGKGIHPLEWFGLSESDADAAKKRITQTVGEIRLLEQVQATALKSSLNNPYSDINKIDKPIKAEPKQKVSDYYEKEARSQFDFYKNNLFEAEFYFNKLNDIEKVNALMRATIAGASADELFAIQQTYEQNSINFSKQIEDKKFAIREQSSKRGLQLTKADADEKKKILDREFQNEMDAIQNRLDAQLKGNRKEPIKQQEDYKQAIAGYILMAMQAGKTAEEIDKLQDKINKVKSTAEGTAAAFTPLNDILNNLATNTLVEFGTQIGNVLSGGEFSLSGFFSMIADALIKIGTHLVMVSKLFLAVDALFASGGALAPFMIPIGIAAIAAGVALKGSLSNKNADTKKFANGGIISGPTMGLMGEYPGAKSNPEVVAPLDKLKSMMGGGGNGEFVLRGSDLVLALQRSNYSLNLRRGS